MSEIVEWEEYSEEDLEAEKEQMKGGSSTYWKPSEGVNIIRFLPKMKGWPGLFKVVREHYINTPTGRRNYTCPRVFNEACVQCDHANELRGSPAKADQDLAYSLFSKKQLYARIIDRAKPEKGVQIYKFGKTVFEELKDLREDDGDYSHPIKGYDVKLRRKGTTQYDTEYKCKKGKVCKLGDMDWLQVDADMHTKFGQRVPPEELIKKLAGTICADMLENQLALTSGKPSEPEEDVPGVEDDLWDDDDI